ncbi:MAG: hypothetical protein ACW98J_10450 [Candidatus Thorarchaeota archaeon]|jgi:coenzyme F420-reducing hydrogenase delta subunit
MIDSSRGSSSREVAIISSIRAAEGDKFAAEINKFAEEIRTIGPNPIRL